MRYVIFFVILLTVCFMTTGCLTTAQDLSTCNAIDDSTGRNICLTNYGLAMYRKSHNPAASMVCAGMPAEDGNKCYYAFAIEAAGSGKRDHAIVFCDYIANPFASSILDDPAPIRNRCYTDIAVILGDPTICDDYITDSNMGYFGLLKIADKEELQALCREEVNNAINKRPPFS